MSYYRKKGQANRNIRQVKGFVCPTCDSLVPRGYEICYNCGDDPTIGSSSGYSSTSVDDGVLDSYFFFIFTFIAPIFYLLSNMIEDPSENIFNFFLLLPNLVIVYFSVSALLKRKIRRNLGCLSGPIRIWVLIFSVLTFINNIRFYISFFIL